MDHRIPTTIPLPAKLVELLEAKFQSGGSLSPTELLEWTQLRNSIDESLQVLKRFASHNELEARAQEALGSLQSLGQAMGVGTFDEAILQSFKLYRVMASYGVLREQLRVTTLQQTDKLIHACKACEAERLPAVELLSIIPLSISEVDGLVHFYKNAADSLPEHIQQAFLKGIHSVQVGIAALQSLPPNAAGVSPPVDVLKAAAADLSNGALILQELQSWGVELAKEELTVIPAVGDFIRQLRLELQEHGKISPELMMEWNEQAFWVLQERWSEDRHDFFMPRYKKDKLVESLDRLMLSLRELSERTPQEQDELLYLLELKFEEVEESGFDMSLLAEHPQSWLSDYFVAVLAKGVPRPHIEEQIATLSGTELDHYSRYLSLYLAEDDRDYLLDALTDIQREVELQVSNDH